MTNIIELIDELCPNGVPFCKIGECCSIEKGKTPIQKAAAGEYPLVVTTTERKSSINYQFDRAGVCIPLVSSRGHGVASLNEIFYQEGKYAVGNILCCVIPTTENTLSARFLHLYLNYSKDFLLVPQMRGGANVSLSVEAIARVKIPVPPIEIQNKIVHILDKFTLLIAELTAELTARKMQYDYYRETLLSDIVNTPLKRLGDTCFMKSGKSIKAILLSDKQDDEHRYPCYGGNGIRGFIGVFSHHGEYPIIGRQGALCGNVNYARGDFYATEHAVVVESKGDYDQRYLFYLLTSMNLNQYKSQGAQPGLAVGNLEKLLAPVPSIDRQKKIVKILDTFDSLCTDISEGIPAEIDARKNQYEYYRDKLLTFKELA